MHPVSAKPIYKPAAIVTAAFIGGPLAAAFMLTENFAVFGRTKINIVVWLCAFAGAVIIAAALFIWGDVALVLPFISPVVAWIIVKAFQQKPITQHMANGGPAKSWVDVLLISVTAFICMAMLFLAALGYAIAWASSPANRLF